MRREICWREESEDGGKREIRVAIVGDRIQWKFRAAKHAHWNRAIKPTPQDWSALLARMEDWYRRRAASHDALELVRRQHAEALAAFHARTP